MRTHEIFFIHLRIWTASTSSVAIVHCPITKYSSVLVHQTDRKFASLFRCKLLRASSPIVRERERDEEEVKRKSSWTLRISVFYHESNQQHQNVLTRLSLPSSLSLSSS